MNLYELLTDLDTLRLFGELIGIAAIVCGVPALSKYAVILDAVIEGVEKANNKGNVKVNIQARAHHKGVEPLLNKRVKRVRAKNG